MDLSVEMRQEPIGYKVAGRAENAQHRAGANSDAHGAAGPSWFGCSGNGGRCHLAGSPEVGVRPRTKLCKENCGIGDQQDTPTGLSRAYGTLRLAIAATRLTRMPCAEPVLGDTIFFCELTTKNP